MPFVHFSRTWLVRLPLVSLSFIALGGMAAVWAAPDAPAKSTAPAKTTATAAASKADSATEKPEKTPATSGRDLSFGLEEVKKINEEIRAGWTDNQITPSPPAPDNEWCRRVFLDLLGRVPSVAELQAFMADKSPDRKAKLVDKILGGDEKYVEEFARNWTTIWSNLLIGRAGGTEQNSMTSRDGMQKYLRDSFTRNKPYDKMVTELVTATGVNVPGEEGFNGATNFLAMKLEEKGAQATAKTAQIFLGMQVQCTQCHNHPFNDWKQQKFWEFNAFFRQTDIKQMGERVGGNRGTRVARLGNENFKGEGGGNIKEAELYYELRNAQMKVAYPVFVDGTAIDRSGDVSDTNRRNELAKLIVSSKYMPEAMVNRLWQHFFGYGFTKPIDDMGPHNPPTHPALLSYLGERYRYKGFNTRELMKWIVLSEPYSLSSRFNKGNVKDDPTLGEKPKFSHYYMRQMRAEELYESLLVATEASQGRGSFEEQEKVKAQWLQQFVVAFGNDEGTESSTFNGTIPQALMMFNGDLIKTATNIDNGSFLAKVANSSMAPGDKINFLYMSALARKPFSNELGAANALLTAHKGNTAAALQDVWWAILNSNEFILQH